VIATCLNDRRASRWGNERRSNETLLVMVLAATSSTAVAAQPVAPEIDACDASGLIALKQRSPDVRDPHP